MDGIYSYEESGGDTLYYRLGDLPNKEAEAFLRKDLRLRNIRLYSNSEWVSKSNWKRNKELHEDEFRVELYISSMPDSFAELLTKNK